MGNLTKIGRIFYGLVVAETGLQTIYYHDFPYWLIPPKHSWIPGLELVAYISGALLILAGACIVFEKKVRTISLLSGAVLLLIFCFCHIPYQFMAASRYLHLLEWENAEKELAFAGGAFVIAACYAEKNEKPFTRFLRRLIPLGAICFSITMISFGILHFLYTKEVADYVPSWAPNHMFWTYFAGSALIGSGIAIILKIRVGLIAALLGTMLFAWFISLHIPRVITSPVAYLGSEITSAFLALAYSGIAFVIAGDKKNA
jgi:uncharacterized membrane protein YphA (DoxX/SURF4 family)/uncharacterized membrane protein